MYILNYFEFKTYLKKIPARDKPFYNRNLQQPREAFIGLDVNKNIYKQKYLNSEIQRDIRNDNRPPLTTLITEQTGYAHTGAGLGPSFPAPVRDPRYNLPYYGNTKPQVLNYKFL